MRSSLSHLITGIFILVTFVQCDDTFTVSTDVEPDPELEKSTLVFPENDSEQPTSITFKWQEIEEVDSFQIQLSGHEDFSSMIADSTIDSTAFDIQGLPHDTTVYWKVRSIAGQQEGPWSNTWKFTTIEQAQNPEPISTDLKSPEDGASDCLTDQELKWTAIASASAYTVQLATDQDFNSIVINPEVEATSYQTSDLSYQETYYWRVKPVLSDGETKWSEVYDFTTIQQASGTTNLAAPVQISPDDGAGNISLQPTFEWSSVDGADYYILHANRINPGEMVIETEVSDTSYTPVYELDPETTHDWRVSAVKDGKKGNWSDIHRFTTTSQSSGTSKVTLASPTDGATGQPISLALEWEALSGINNYQVQLATSSDFFSPVVDQTTAATSHEVSGLNNDQQYFWRVQADDDGDTGNWSSVYSFTTKSNSNNTSPPPSGGSAEGDRQALVDLYNATNGSQWNNHSGWLNGNPSNAWHGVEVNASGRVVRLNLRANNLSGSLPKSLGNLTELTYLNVKQNRLSGQLPWAAIGNMTSLTHLLLNGRTADPDPATGAHHPGKDTNGSWSGERTNDFTGTMGPEVGNLVRLKHLELMGVNSEHTGLTGAIPSEIGNLTQLKGLYLDFNSFSSLPGSIGNLTNLLQFGITDNNFQGSPMPAAMGNWIRLKFLWAHEAGFAGSLPDLSRLDDLCIFIVGNNNLEGSIPGYLFDGTTPNINMVNLAFNNFTGNIPQFHRPNNIKALQVNGNNLTGSIPASISNIPSIKNFGVAWNNLSGTIPDLSHMYQLRYFRGNDNNFTGTVPMVDTSNNALQFLHFQNNEMSGQIPAALAEVGNLPIFRSFNVSNNNFSTSDLQALINALKADGNLNVLNY